MCPDGVRFSLRRAGLDDLPAIVALQAKSWRTAYRGLVDEAYLEHLPLQDWMESWRVHLFSGGGAALCVVAESDGRICGFASAGPASGAPDLGPEVGELHTIYIEAALFGSGLGAQLLEAALEHLRESGFGAVVLWVLAGNARAIAFYRRAGFTPDSARGADCWGATSVERVRYRRPL